MNQFKIVLAVLSISALTACEPQDIGVTTGNASPGAATAAEACLKAKFQIDSRVAFASVQGECVSNGHGCTNTYTKGEPMAFTMAHESDRIQTLASIKTFLEGLDYTVSDVGNTDSSFDGDFQVVHDDRDVFVDDGASAAHLTAIFIRVKAGTDLSAAIAGACEVVQ